MVKQWEFYAAMAFDIEAAPDNGTTAERMMEAINGSHVLREAQEYANSSGAPWPPSAEWVRANVQFGDE